MGGVGNNLFHQPVGDIFLRLLFMLVIPLLVSALIIGVAEMGELSALKKVGTQTLVYTVVVSTIAVAISLAVVNYSAPASASTLPLPPLGRTAER